MMKSKAIKVLSALKNVDEEAVNLLSKDLNDDYVLKNKNGNKDIVMKEVEEFKPDIFIVYEDVIAEVGKITNEEKRKKANESIISFVLNMKKQYKEIRIILLMRNREKDDEVFNDLIENGVYDFFYNSVKAKEITNVIQNPNTFEDIKSYMKTVKEVKSID